MFFIQQNKRSQQKQRKRQQQFLTRRPTITNTTTWLLILFFSCTTLYPLCTHSTPIHSTRGTITKENLKAKANDRGPTSSAASSTSSSSSSSSSSLCAHDSIAELIKKSPVILKALGAHIFTDDDFNGLGVPLGLSTIWGSGSELKMSESVSTLESGSGSSRLSSELNTLGKQNEFLVRTTLDETRAASSLSPSATSTSAEQTQNNAKEKITTATATSSQSTIFATTSTEVESILITLTPETIYKGASLLKMSPPGSENGARSNSAAESATLYDGQLNATLQPLHCFDAGLLKLLPTELIVFGKLVTAHELQQQQYRLQLQQPLLSVPQEPQEPQQQLPHSSKPALDEDILHISINGFHRWSPQFENHIWKHLGWDDWSDFTLCSVTCGKGVQQRFRRCLLDNPMVNLNMNANLNTLEVNAIESIDIEDDEDVIKVDDNDDDDIVNDTTDDDISFESSTKITAEHEELKRTSTVDDESNVVVQSLNSSNVIAGLASDDASATPYVASKSTSLDDEQLTEMEQNSQTIKSNNVMTSALNKVTMTTLMSLKTTTTATNTKIKTPTPTTMTMTMAKKMKMKTMLPVATDELRHLRPVTLTSDNKENVGVANTSIMDTDVNSLNDNDGEIMRTENMKVQKHKKNERTRKLHRKRKTTKSFSTMFCEGYNIEQRNCNTFECSDDVSDLLKFYKKSTSYEETVFSPAATNDFNTIVLSSSVNGRTDVVTSVTNVAAYDFVDTAAESSIGKEDSNGMAPVTTPANMGYIRNWHNALNFTIMLTLRVKNDSKNTATIFSIRNTTHNLYLDQCQVGLRLYLERDNSTEMLPIKFNLYDYRWHQVAISIQNGDFISIYVDCSWTNSFVVSKRLYTLPLDADVEIGRGFNGELQQLLLLPDNQEHHQCSSRRTSINEVKRYIIDTFIGDYSN